MLAVRETPASYPKPRLLDRVRDAIRGRHYSRRTEKAYVFFHAKRHPAEMGAPEVARFLTSLAVDGRVAASTQNQALNALLFLYRVVLEVDLPWLNEVVRARRPESLPTVLTRDEVRRVLEHLEGTPRLMVLLLYGAGLRLLECAQLRIKDVDFAANQLVVRSGKFAKDRVTLFPTAAKTRLLAQIEAVRRQHRVDLEAGAGWVAVPDALARKYPNAGREPRLAVGVPGDPPLRGATHRPAPSPSPTRVRRLACRQARAAPGRRLQARELSHVPAFIRHSPAGRRSRHQDRPAAARASRRQHDDDLHPCPEPRPVRRA